MPDTNIWLLINQVNKKPTITRIVFISSLENPVILRKLISENISGIISKIDSAQEVMECINGANEKRKYLSTSIRKIFYTTNPDPIQLDLTKKEIEVVMLVARGKTVEQISEQLTISKHTVITHKRNILSKTGFKSTSDLILYMVKNDLIQLT